MKNTARPTRRIRRRPRRSAIRPPTNTNDANAMLYPVSPHDNVERLVPAKSCSIAGNATLTAVTARPTTIDVDDASSNARHAWRSTGSRVSGNKDWSLLTTT